MRSQRDEAAPHSTRPAGQRHDDSDAAGAPNPSLWLLYDLIWAMTHHTHPPKPNPTRTVHILSPTSLGHHTMVVVHQACAPSPP